MQLGFAKISIQGTLIVIEKEYSPYVIDLFTCLEVRDLARELNLGNLKHIDCVLNTIFNQSQCEEILEKEIPLLLASKLSEKARITVNGLEYALKDITDPFNYLLLEGD